MATINELKTLALHAAKGTAPANFTADNVEVAFRGEMSKLAGSYLEFQKNKYEIFEIIMSAADEIVPNKVIDSMAPFAEVVRVGFGELMRTGWQGVLDDAIGSHLLSAINLDVGCSFVKAKDKGHLL